VSRTDRDDFERLLVRHRAEIQLYCYRMVGSLQDAEDLTQETSLRAWRAFEDLDHRAGFRTWLYRIATNACLDHLRSQARRRRPAVAAEEFAKVPAQVAVPWLQPCPTATADLVAAASATPSTQPGPDQLVVARDTMRLAFVAAVQYLPRRERGAFLLRDCLGWPVAECAEALGSSPAAVNSALQRARATMRTVLDADPARWTDPRPSPTENEALVSRYIEAVESADHERIGALLADDVRVSHAARAGGNLTDAVAWYAGRATVIHAWHPVLHAAGHPTLLLVPVPMNDQPGVASYLRMPGQATYEAFALTALTAVDEQVTEVASFGAELFGRFGLPDRGTEEALRSRS
jgi:RNA polymerase sigma-70 factor (ECF subfamily)